MRRAAAVRWAVPYVCGECFPKTAAALCTSSSRGEVSHFRCAQAVGWRQLNKLTDAGVRSPKQKKTACSGTSLLLATTARPRGSGVPDAAPWSGRRSDCHHVCRLGMGRPAGLARRTHEPGPSPSGGGTAQPHGPGDGLGQFRPRSPFDSQNAAGSPAIHRTPLRTVPEADSPPGLEDPFGRHKHFSLPC